MSGFANIGFGTKIYFEDTPSIKIHVNQTSNCDWKVSAETALSPLGVIKLTGLSIPPCDKARVITAQDTLLYALGDLQAQISCCCANRVVHVYDDGSGVVVVDNTDPLNPIVGFGGVNVDGVTITGDGSIAHPLVAIGGGGVTPHAMTSTDGTITFTGTPLTSLLQDVNLSVTSANITSSDGSVILGGTPVGSVLKAVDLTVNPATIIATIAQPDTQIVFGTGASVSSNSNWTYNDHFDSGGGNISNILQMLDPNTGTQALFIRTAEPANNTANFILTADNLIQSGAFAQLNCDTSGQFTLDTYAASTLKSKLRVTPLDGASYLHGIQVEIDGLSKAQFSATSLDLRTNDSTTYQLRFYEYNSGTGTNYIGFQAPAVNLAGNVIWSLPVSDSTGTQALVSDGAGNLSWASFGAGSVTSVSGTLNRITSTGGATPVIDISAAYVGQTSITTLGTITTGTWTATKIGTAYGGTNADSSASTGVAQVSAGTWSFSTALANGTTATTQAANDNSTKVATTAYVATAVASFTAGSDKQIIFNSGGTLTGDNSLQYDLTNTQILGSDGAKANPTYSFISSVSTGIYSDIPNVLKFATNGIDAWIMDNSQVLYPATDCQNIGIAGTNRIGTIYMCSNIDYVTNMNFTVSSLNKVVFDSSGNITAGTYNGNTIGAGSTSGTNTGDQTIASLSPLTTKGDIFVFSTVNTRLAVASGDGKILQVSSGAATGLAWSTPTYPSASGTLGKILRSDGTNNVYSTFTIPDTYTTGDLIQATASNTLTALAGVAAGSYLRSGGVATANVWSTLTLPNTAAVSTILYASASNVISALATANTSALVTNSTGVPAYTSGSTGNRVLTTDGTTISFTQVTEAMILLADNTTDDVSSTAHGFFPKLVANRVYYVSNTGVLTALALGASGTVLTSNGATSAPTFSAASGGGITIGTTTVTSGTGTRLIYETSGNVVGEVSGATSDGTSVTFGSANLLATRPKITTSIDDANGNQMLAFTATANAVDYFTFTNAATANPATITIVATGSDSNINLVTSPKGTGKFMITDGSDLTKKWQFDFSGASTSITASFKWSPTTGKTITFPNITGTVALVGTNNNFSAAQTFTAGVSITTASGLTITDLDIILSATTGTKIGTATTQKLAFFNSTPIVQPANTVAIDTLLVNLGLRASGGVSLFDTDIKAGVVGKGFYVKEGTNATMGTDTLSGGTKVVSTNKVTASSRIFLTDSGGGVVANLGSLYISAVSAGTSFTVSSTNALDSSNFNWIIIEPA